MGGLLGYPGQRTKIKESFVVNKSPEDKRMYRGLLLSNDLNVVLVSDPTTAKSAVCIASKNGQYMQRREISGTDAIMDYGDSYVAAESDLRKYIADNEGVCEIRSFADGARYCFDVCPSHLKRALEKLMLGLQTAELDNNAAQIDAGDICHIRKDESSTESHLDDNLSVAPRVSVCVVGKESLDELEQHITDMGFANLSNENVTRWQNERASKCTNNLKEKAAEKAKGVVRTILLLFPVLCDSGEHTAQASALIGSIQLIVCSLLISRHGAFTYREAYLIGHEGTGTLHASLKKNAWINKLNVSTEYDAQQCGSIKINIDITEEGWMQRENVVKMVCSYIGLLQQCESLKPWWDEMTAINELVFRFKVKEPPFEYASYVARRALVYPTENVLFVEQRCFPYDHTLITNLLSHMRPSNLVYSVFTQSDNQDCCADSSFATGFGEIPISKDLLIKCDTAINENNDKLALPLFNSFIPKNFFSKNRHHMQVSLGLSTMTMKDGSRFPRLVHADEWSRLWHYVDEDCTVPRCTVYLWISSPSCYQSSSDFSNLTAIINCFEEMISAKIYEATLLGFNYHIKAKSRGIELMVEGFNDTVSQLIETLFFSLLSLHPSDHVFNKQKEKCAIRLHEVAMEPSWSQAVFQLNQVLVGKPWSKRELLTAMDGLTLVGVVKFVDKLFSSFHIESIVYGDLDESAYTGLIKRLVTTARRIHVQSEPILDQELLQFKELRISEGCCGVLPLV